MQKSELINEIGAALCKAQPLIKKALKDSENPAFKKDGKVSKYADFESVWDACRDALNSNGLAITQLTDECDSAVIVETMLIHTSGQWLMGRLKLPLAKMDPQGVGSAITYGRRFGLEAMAGVARLDDDGNAASEKGEGGKPEQKADKNPNNLTDGDPAHGLKVKVIASAETKRKNGYRIDAVDANGEAYQIMVWAQQKAAIAIAQTLKAGQYLIVDGKWKISADFDPSIWADVITLYVPTKVAA